jgi:hypothetical protein
MTPDLTVASLVAATVAAARDLVSHPALPGALRDQLASAAVGLCGGLGGSDTSVRAARITHLEEAVGLCACTLGLCPPVLASLRAVEQLRAHVVVSPRARWSARSAATLDPSEVAHLLAVAP